MRYPANLADDRELERNTEWRKPAAAFMHKSQTGQFLGVLGWEIAGVRTEIGSSGRTRTYNPSVNSRMLCH